MIIEIGWQIPKEAITKDWEGYLWQILLFPAATVCSSARSKEGRSRGRGGRLGFPSRAFRLHNYINQPPAAVLSTFSKWISLRGASETFFFFFSVRVN